VLSADERESRDQRPQWSNRTASVLLPDPAGLILVNDSAPTFFAVGDSSVSSALHTTSALLRTQEFQEPSQRLAAYATGIPGGASPFDPSLLTEEPSSAKWNQKNVDAFFAEQDQAPVLASAAPFTANTANAFYAGDDSRRSLCADHARVESDKWEENSSLIDEAGPWVAFAALSSGHFAFNQRTIDFSEEKRLHGLRRATI
jgi:hypothetical protein